MKKKEKEKGSHCRRGQGSTSRTHYTGRVEAKERETPTRKKKNLVTVKERESWNRTWP